MVDERTTLLNTINARWGKKVGYLIRHNSFFKTLGSRKKDRAPSVEEKKRKKLMLRQRDNLWLG